MKQQYTVNVIRDVPLPSVNEGKWDHVEEHSLDDAIRLTESGRFHRMIVFFSGLVMMGATIENISVSFILPYADCDLHLSTLEFALLGSIPFFGIVLSSHFWGFMADTWGRRKVIRLTAILSFILSFISSFITNIWMLIMFRLAVGLCISGLQASVFSYVSEFHTKERAPTAAAIVSTLMPVIFLYSSIVGMIVIPMEWSLDLYFVTFVPWRLFMIVICLVNLINSIAIFFLPESPKYLVAINKSEQALAVLQKMYTMNTKESIDRYPVKRLKAETTGNKLSSAKGSLDTIKLVWNQTKPIFVTPYLTNTWKLCYMTFVLFAVGHGVFIWPPDFFVQLQSNPYSNQTICEIVGHEKVIKKSGSDCGIYNEDRTTYIVIFTIGVVFTTLSGLVSFYLKKIETRILAPVWVTLSAACAIVLLFITEFYLITISFILFISCSLCAAIIGAVSVNLYPTHIRAMATCFIFMCGRVGGLVGSNVIGFLVEDNCTSIFYLYSALTMSCAIVFLMIKKQEPDVWKQSNGGA